MARCYYVNIDPHYDTPEMSSIKRFIDDEVSKCVIILPNENGNNILYLRKVRKQTFKERITKERNDIFPIIVKEE